MPFTLSHPAVVLALRRTGLPVAAMVAGVLVWVLLLRDALVDTAPAPVRERLEPVAPYSRRQWVLLPVAAVLGSLTQVTWDLFTHGGRWGVAHVTWLHTQHLGLLGAQWAQILSTGVGLVVVVGWSVRHVASLPRRPRPARVSRLSQTAAPAVLLLAAVVGGAAAVRQVSHGLHAVALHGAVIGTVAMVAGLVLVSLTWLLLRDA